MLPPPHPKIPRYHHHHYDHHCVVFSHQEVERPLAFPNNPTADLESMPPAIASSLDEEVFFPAEMYHYQQQQHQETLEAVLRQQVTAAPAAISEPGNGSGRKRPFRTDRHSKIRTAQGVRDRRMRLSVGVARDFFGLQDLLGFDKASNTVDWLLTQSKPAIDRLSLSDSTPPPGAPPAAASAAATTMKEKGEAAATASSSTSTGCFRDERAETMESIGGGDGGELNWFASGAPAMEQQPMEGLDYYYQCYQLEEMMRAATTEDQY